MRKLSARDAMADPNVEEIRTIRAKLSERFDNDIDKLCEYLRRKEAEYGDRIVKPAERSWIDAGTKYLEF